MIVGTWNINGVRARLDNLISFLRLQEPDILALQEIKCADEAFPAERVRELGYHVATHGQKGFNGVALLSKVEPIEMHPRLPGDEDDAQARFLEGVWQTGSGPLRVASLYLPNGNPVGTEKFAYKLAWMRRLERFAAARCAEGGMVVLAGDYNIIPEPRDARTPEAWVGDALYQPESRATYRRLLNLGFVDAVRATSEAEQDYTFWDYQAGSWQKNNGIRIDHLLLSPEAAERLDSVGISRDLRSWEKPSDHVPVLADLRL